MGLQSCEESYEIPDFPKKETDDTTDDPKDPKEDPKEDPEEEIPEDLYSKKFADWIDYRSAQFSLSEFTDYSGDAYYAGMKLSVYSKSDFMLEDKEFDGYYGSQATQLEITSAVFSDGSLFQEEEVPDVPGRVEIKSATSALIYPTVPLKIDHRYYLKLTYREVVYNGKREPTFKTRTTDSYSFYNTSATETSFYSHITARYPHDVLYLKEYPEIFYSSSRDLSSLFKDGKKPLFRFRNTDTYEPVYVEGELRVGADVKTPDSWSEVALSLDKVELQKGLQYEINIYAYTEGVPYEEFVRENQYLDFYYVNISKYDYLFEAVKDMEVKISVLHDESDDYDYLRYSFKSDESIDTELMKIAPDLQNTWWYTANFPDNWVSKWYRRMNGNSISFSSEAREERYFFEDRKLPAYFPGNYPILFEYTIPGRNIVTSTSSKDVYYYPENEEDGGNIVIE
ncbi:MAG: hypothetical protein MJZ01_05840 [Bacteroidales bacterium]|nr:hypothetical protein [Bacteroidales bacterium]